ncbi:MAG: nucleotide exchange factor GrpE [Gammaproteobacteria bacterium]
MSENPEHQPAEESADAQSLEDQLAEAQAKADENWAQYLRAAAELDNTRKRALRDVEHAHRYALERFAGDLAPVRDSLELGLAADATVESLRSGVEATLKQLDQALARHGVEVIDPFGQPFDPERHEAMSTLASADAAADSVVQVIQKGLVLNGRLVRPARVIVAVAPPDTP